MERNQETLNDIHDLLEQAWSMANNLMLVLGNIEDAIEEAREADEYVPDISYVDDVFINSLIKDLESAMKEIKS